MKHIVIDARIISSTTGRYVERLLHYLEQIDHEHRYTVLVREKDLDYWKPTNPNFSVQVAEFGNYSFAEQIGLFFLVRSLKADLVHFCQPHQPILYRRNKVTTIHDLTLLKTYNSDKNWFVYHFKQLLGRVVFRSIVKHSTQVITPTQFTKDEITGRYRVDSTKITVTHLAAEMRTGKQTPYSGATDPYIMYVGQQSDYKNIKRLGDAHQKLLKKHPSLKLILVGKIDAAAERNKAYFESNAYKNILFTGFVKDDELNWLYAHTACYVFPSLMEGFGLPALEAMTHHAPVASSNATCLPEVYGEAAHYFDPLDCNSIVQAVDDILSNSKQRSQLIEKGDTQVTYYSWKETAEKTLAVYRDCL